MFQRLNNGHFTPQKAGTFNDQVCALSVIAYTYWLRATHRATYKDFSDDTIGVFNVAQTLRQALPYTRTLVLDWIEGCSLGNQAQRSRTDSQ